MVNVNLSHPTYHRCLFLCLHITHPTYISNILYQSPNTTISTPRKFQHTFLQTKKGMLSHPFRFFNLLPTHPSHLLLYPFTDTPQEVFQHIDSVDSKLLHKFICFIKLLLKCPILGFQVLILSLQTLILVFKIQHLIKVCLLPNLILFIRKSLMNFRQLIASIRQILLYHIQPGSLISKYL